MLVCQWVTHRRRRGGAGGGGGGGGRCHVMEGGQVTDASLSSRLCVSDSDSHKQCQCVGMPVCLDVHRCNLPGGARTVSVVAWPWTRAVVAQSMPVVPATRCHGSGVVPGQIQIVKLALQACKQFFTCLLC